MGKSSLGLSCPAEEFDRLSTSNKDCSLLIFFAGHFESWKLPAHPALQFRDCSRPLDLQMAVKTSRKH